MRPTSIILSPLRSRTALTVAWGLRANGVRVLCGPALSDAAFGPLSIAASTEDWRVHAFGAAVRSVWHYRPKAPALRAGDCPMVHDERLQFERTVCGLVQLGVEALWVNDPRRALDSENLLLQLRAARQAGLAFPQTLVSNDPLRVREFVERHGRVVCRRFVPHPERPAIELDAAQARAATELTPFPAIYQRCIDPVGRVRVVVIGARQFAARIDDEPGARHGLATRAGEALAPAHAWELPAPQAGRLAAFTGELGLTHACVDFALDATGELQFLGVDARAHGLGIEERVPQLPVLRALCALLAQGRVDYDLDAAADVSLAEWRDSGRGHEHALPDRAAQPERMQA